MGMFLGIFHQPHDVSSSFSFSCAISIAIWWVYRTPPQQGMADGQRLVELAQEVITRLEREEAENKSALDRLTEGE